VLNERTIVEGPNGNATIVAIAADNFYAANAKCPHLGLSHKKKGEISATGGDPAWTCNFHHSCFNMKTGKCTK